MKPNPLIPVFTRIALCLGFILALADTARADSTTVPTDAVATGLAPQYRPSDIPTAHPALGVDTAARPTVDIANIDHPLAPVLHAMKQGRWHDARQQVQILLAQNPADMDALFLAGQIAEQLQQPQQAADYYQQMLAHNSQLPRPRLELAKVLWQAGEAAAAEYHFRLALSQELPEPVQKHVQAYLHAIKQHKSSWQISATVAPGSNINQGSGHQSVTIGDKEFTLSPESQAQSGVGLQLQLSGQYRFGTQRQWFGTAQIHWQEYGGRSLDNTYGRLMLGRHINTGSPQRHLQAALGVQHVQYQQHALYSGAVARLDYAQQWSENKQWFIGWEGQQLHYRPEYAYLHARQHWLNAGIAGVARGRTSYQIAVQAGSSRAQERTYGFYSVGADLSVRHLFDWQQLTLGAKAAYTRTRYRGEAPFFGQTRQEQQYTGQLSLLKRNWSWHGFAPELALQYSRNRANIALYDRHSRQIRFTLNRVF